MLKKLFNKLFKNKRKADFNYAGHNFYVIPMKDLTYQRKSGYIISLQEVEWKVTGKDLDELTDLLRDALKDGEISRAGYLVETLASFREQYLTWKVMYKLANNFILVDDEPIKEFSEKHTKLKFELAQNYDAVKDFFLSKAIEHLQTFNNGLTTSQVKDYLEEKKNQRIEEHFSSVIQSNKRTTTNN